MIGSAATRAGANAADALSSRAGQRAQKLWAKLRRSVEADSIADAAAAQAAADPSDEEALRILAGRLAKILREDPELRGDVAGILEGSDRNTTRSGGRITTVRQNTGPGGISIGGNNYGTATTDGNPRRSRSRSQGR
jgi:hypothetical protein